MSKSVYLQIMAHAMWAAQTMVQVRFSLRQKKLPWGLWPWCYDHWSLGIDDHDLEGCDHDRISWELCCSSHHATSSKVLLTQGITIQQSSFASAGAFNAKPNPYLVPCCAPQQVLQPPRALPVLRCSCSAWSSAQSLPVPDCQPSATADKVTGAWLNNPMDITVCFASVPRSVSNKIFAADSSISTVSSSPAMPWRRNSQHRTHTCMAMNALMRLNKSPVQWTV